MSEFRDARVWTRKLMRWPCRNVRDIKARRSVGELESVAKFSLPGIAACLSAACVLVLHVALLAHSAKVHSPTFSEVGHLPAGIAHWRLGMFQLYRVNPPLPRMVAAAGPLLFSEPVVDWTNYGIDDHSRDEIPMGIRFLKANGPDSFQLFRLARWSSIPFSILGAIVCALWSRRLWGNTAGGLSLSLWCFSPWVLGHGALMMPDVPSAALGITASFAFSHWLDRLSWATSLVAGVALGMALLCKTTLLVLYPIWFSIWLCQYAIMRTVRIGMFWHQAAMLALVFALSVYVLNAGYAFKRTGQSLGSFTFLSQALGGKAAVNSQPRLGNRFSNSFLSSVPVLLPADYVLGIDRQRTDFELGSRSYVRGKWKNRGWWWYHLYGLAIKTPVGTLSLILLSMLLMATRRYRVFFRYELELWLPVIVVLALVSSQTGFSMHVRYVIPAMPFLFILAGRCAKSLSFAHWPTMIITIVCVLFTAASSLVVHPHHISFFNRIVGGPSYGHQHLLDSNIAWGQDLLLLQEWLSNHPEVTRLRLASFGWVDPRLAGINFSLPPTGPKQKGEDLGSLNMTEIGPLPGWYVIDVNFLHATHWSAATGEGRWQSIPTSGLNYEYFLLFEPVDRIGYSMHVYHISLQQANEVRESVGLALLSE